jgi:threonine/homoserine efflux transporter RhtA
VDEQSRAALAQVPLAARWARGFTGTIAISPKAFRRHSAPAAVHAAVEGIAQACVPEPDQMLHDLLASAIGECAAWCGRRSGLSTGRDAALTAAAH